MSTISFGGLATGLDTNSLISQLMKAEQQPLINLQQQEATQQSRLSALGSFNSKLTSFLQNIQDLDSASGLQPKTATPSAQGYFYRHRRPATPCPAATRWRSSIWPRSIKR